MLNSTETRWATTSLQEAIFQCELNSRGKKKKHIRTSWFIPFISPKWQLFFFLSISKRRSLDSQHIIAFWRRKISVDRSNRRNNLFIFLLFFITLKFVFLLVFEAEYFECRNFAIKELSLSLWTLFFLIRRYSQPFKASGEILWEIDAYKFYQQIQQGLLHFDSYICTNGCI